MVHGLLRFFVRFHTGFLRAQVLVDCCLCKRVGFLDLGFRVFFSTVPMSYIYKANHKTVIQVIGLLLTRDQRGLGRVLG